MILDPPNTQSNSVVQEETSVPDLSELVGVNIVVGGLNSYAGLSG